MAKKEEIFAVGLISGAILGVHLLKEYIIKTFTSKKTQTILRKVEVLVDLIQI